MPNGSFSLRARLRSFRYAFNGLKVLLHDEHNARVHLAATVLVVVLGFLFHASLIEWLFLIVSISFVFVCELFNSAVERTCDAVATTKNPYIGKAKDLAAAAILVSALSAALVGGIVFIPKLVQLWSEF